MPLNRRHFISGTAGALGATCASTLAPSLQAAAAERSGASPFILCLNTSTIRGQKLGLADVVDLVAKAGYQAIEPWIREIEDFVKAGGSLPDLGKRIKDHGLSVESAIGFCSWLVDDDATRSKALEQAKREMDMLVQIGGKRLAAPPVGATKEAGPPLAKIATRYRALLEVGQSTGIVPQVEVWGHSRTLSRLGEALYVAADANHPQACVLADVYHLYRGGSDFQGLRLMSGEAMRVFHINDYPAAPPREQLTDADRVYPGDGVAPLVEIFRTLRTNGYHGALSLELFNRSYWAQDPLTVLKTGLEKTQTVVAKSLAES